jgi:NAD(P)-dependent dehydrogenase (short-subunit alcohol dehydrogenase family)
MAATAVVTGVNRGIGAAITRALLSRHWRVHGLGRQPPEWGTGDCGHRFEFHACDLGSNDQIHGAAAAISDPIEILINNAAVFGGRSYHGRDADPEDFATTLQVNVVAPTLLSRLLRPRLLEGSRRLIVMMSTGNASLSGNTGGEMLSYRASKSALNQVTRTLAAEWRTENLSVVALNPGWVRTDMGGPNAPLDVEVAAEEIVDLVTSGDLAELSGAFINVNRSPLPW